METRHIMATGLTTQIDVDAMGVAWIVGANTKVKEVYA